MALEVGAHRFDSIINMAMNLTEPNMDLDFIKRSKPFQMREKMHEGAMCQNEAEKKFYIIIGAQ